MWTIVIICLGLLSVGMTSGEEDDEDAGPAEDTTVYRQNLYNFRPKSIFMEDGQEVEGGDEEDDRYRSFYDNFQDRDRDKIRPTHHSRDKPRGDRDRPYLSDPFRSLEEDRYVPRPEGKRERSFDRDDRDEDRGRLDRSRPDQRKYYYGSGTTKPPQRNPSKGSNWKDYGGEPSKNPRWKSQDNPKRWKHDVPEVKSSLPRSPPIRTPGKSGPSWKEGPSRDMDDEPYRKPVMPNDPISRQRPETDRERDRERERERENRPRSNPPHRSPSNHFIKKPSVQVNPQDPQQFHPIPNPRAQSRGESTSSSTRAPKSAPLPLPRSEIAEDLAGAGAGLGIVIGISTARGEDVETSHDDAGRGQNEDEPQLIRKSWGALGQHHQTQYEQHRVRHPGQRGGILNFESQRIHAHPQPQHPPGPVYGFGLPMPNPGYEVYRHYY